LRAVPPICVSLLAAIPLLGQTAGGLSERIRTAPLTPEERQSVNTALEQKNFDRIETVLATATPPGAPPERAASLYGLLGGIEFVGGRMAQAVRAFQQADARKPLDDHDRFTLAMALVEVDDLKASRVELTRLSQSHPNQPIYLYWLARLDYFQRLYDDAVEKLRRVVRMDPESARGYDNLGLSYDMLGRMDEAQAAFLKAVALNRKQPAPSAWPPHNLGYLQLRLQQFPQAEENLREALKYDPKFAEAHYHLARVLENDDRNDEAIAEYKSAAALDPKLAEPLYSLGLLYRRRGREAEAVSALAEYRRRRALSPDSP
jgi:tetratricopeptide (TPR) repeat protein